MFIPKYEQFEQFVCSNVCLFKNMNSSNSLCVVMCDYSQIWTIWTICVCSNICWFPIMNSLNSLCV